MKVAILAQGASWAGVRDAVVDEVWAINMMALKYPHNLLFHMDDCRVQEARALTNSDMQILVDVLQSHPAFYTSTVYPEYPGARAFPLEDVVNTLGTTYLNSTAAYAVAFAIFAGVTELHLYGLDFSYPHAHRAEAGRGCVEHLIGIAMERGITVVIPPDGTLMDACVPAANKPYGYDAHDVTFRRVGQRTFVDMTPKPIPTAAEMEARYA